LAATETKKKKPDEEGGMVQGARRNL
jgi:hypothetical protein